MTRLSTLISILRASTLKTNMTSHDFRVKR